MISIYLIIVMTLTSFIKGETESVNTNTKEDNNHRSPASDYWKNHRYNIDSIYGKYREGKSNNEPYFSEPNNNDQYETMPNTIQITAIPGKMNEKIDRFSKSELHYDNKAGGVGGVHGLGQFPIGLNQFGGFGGFGNLGGLGGLGGIGGIGGLGSLGGNGGWHNNHGWHNQRPIFYISKKSDWFSWLIPLLLLLGAPFLLGIILIPVVLKSIIFILQICRNLGILLPLIPTITGGMNQNPIIPTTG